MENKYLSPKEFAAKANVSPQTIYKQMEGRLSSYVEIINGKKKINAVALQEFYNVVDNSNQQETTEINQETSQNQPNSTEATAKVDLDNQPSSTENQPKEDLEKRISELEKFIKDKIEKDEKEKDFLREQIAQKDKVIEKLTENLQMAQQLAAADKKKLLELEQKQEQEKEIVEAEGIISEEKKEDNKPRKSFLARLFRL